MAIKTGPSAGFMGRNPQARNKTPGLGAGQRSRGGMPVRRPPIMQPPPITAPPGTGGIDPAPPMLGAPGGGLNRTMPVPIGGGPIERIMPMPGRVPGYTPPPMGGGKMPLPPPPDGLNSTMPIDVGAGNPLQKIIGRGTVPPGYGGGVSPGMYPGMGGQPMPPDAEIAGLRRYFMS